MPIAIKNALSTKKAESLKKAGMHADGDGLYLRVTDTGKKSWVFRYRLGEKRSMMGLGSFPDVGVADARKAASEAREIVEAGKDPVVSRIVAETKIVEDREAMPSFGEYGLQVIELWIPGFKNPKHIDQWKSSINHYCKAIFDVPVNEVETEHVLKVLRPIWNKLPVTARRVQGRMKRILDAAKVEKLRAGENPAAWEGHLKLILPHNKKLKKGHHKAIPYAECPAFLYELRSMSRAILAGGEKGKSGVAAIRQENAASMSQLVLEFIMHTVSRTGEARLAKLSEIDFVKMIWTVPPERMKSGREHRVPLTPRAIEIIREATRGINDPDSFIFRARDGHKALSNMAALMCLKGLMPDATVHGLRSSFRDWVGEETEHAREVAEAALGHIIGDEAEQAYRRGDALERRRKVMLEWSEYILSDPRLSQLVAA